MSNRKKLKPALGRTRLEVAVQNFVKTPLRYNGYICTTCDRGYLSVDVDEGVTPMFMPCLATEGCTGTARSMMYPDGDPPAELGPATVMWYKPDAEEFKKLSPPVQDHIRKGGLARKATTEAPEWVKRLI